MRITVLLLMLLLLVSLPIQVSSSCDEAFGDLWQPSWATVNRTDLRCSLGERCKKEPSVTKSEEYDICCTCRSCAIWEGSEVDLFIEYVSVLGKSLVLSDKAPNESDVYKIEHTDSEMTEIPSNLYNMDNETNLKQKYPDEFNDIQGYWENIVTLNFENNKIHILPDLNCLVRLDSLNLRNNKLTHVSNTSFTKLTSLRSVDFFGNHIQEIDPNILNSDHMQSLFYVNFSHNEMTKLDVTNTLGLYPACHIDYRSNKITEFINEANFTLDLTVTYGPGFVSLSDNVFSTWPDFEVLLNLDDITQLGHLIGYGFDFTNIHLVCDCNIEEFMSLAYDVISVLWRKYMNITCTAPEDLAGQLVTDVDPVRFICPVETGCDPRCTCVDIPNKETLFIDCSNSDLKALPEIPYSRFSNYVSLNVSGNQITRIENQWYLSKISVLDISKNNLLEIDDNVTHLLENASYVDISNNPTLRQLPQTFQYHNVCSRNMRNLQISCDCESLWIETWLHSKHCDTRYNLFQCDIPKVGLKPALSFSNTDLECSPNQLPYLIETITVAATILILILIGIPMFIFRYELLILYLRTRQKGRNTVLPMNKYDVFLSFNDTDDDVTHWVNSELEPKLIEAGYRVFQSSRDVAFGAERDSEIISILAKTRNFLTIMSDSYLNEVDDGMRSWTENEWKYGWNNFKTDRSKNIVLVNFDHVSSFDVLHRQIKAFLRVGCTVDFKNHDRKIMEEIFKNLGKPFKMPEPAEKAFENKNLNCSPYDLFRVEFHNEKCAQNEKESFNNGKEEKLARDGMEQENATILKNYKHGSILTKEGETITLKGQRQFRKCQYRKCYACSHGNGDLQKMPKSKISEISSYNNFSKNTECKNTTPGDKNQTRPIDKHNIYYTCRDKNGHQNIVKGNPIDHTIAESKHGDHTISSHKQKTPTELQDKHNNHNTPDNKHEDHTTSEDHFENETELFPEHLALKSSLLAEPATHTPVTDTDTGSVKPATHTPVTDTDTGSVKPATHTPVTGSVKPATDTPVTGSVKPATDTGSVKPATHTPVTDTGSVKPATHTPVTDTGSVKPATHTPVTDTGSVKPATHTPVTGSVKPATDTPVTDAGSVKPATHTPVTDTGAVKLANL